MKEENITEGERTFGWMEKNRKIKEKCEVEKRRGEREKKKVRKPEEVSGKLAGVGRHLWQGGHAVMLKSNKKF
jgi:hypothetical protein